MFYVNYLLLRLKIKLKINDNNKLIVLICIIVYKDRLFVCLLFECFGKKVVGGYVMLIFLNLMVFKLGLYNWKKNIIYKFNN